MSSSPLLALPPGLRNTIYRLVLIEPGKIQIHNQPPPEPALLRVNKRIRKEASSIYYKENTFRFHIRDFNIEVLRKCCASAAQVLRKWSTSSRKRKRCHFNYMIYTCYDWPELLEWLKAYYDGRCINVGERHDKDACPVHSLFGLVSEMKRKQDLEWEQVTKNLEYVHQGLRATKSGWL